MTNRVFNALLTIMVFSFSMYVFGLTVQYVHNKANPVERYTHLEADQHCVVDMRTEFELTEDGYMSYAEIEAQNARWLRCQDKHWQYRRRGHVYPPVPESLRVR